MSDQLYIHCDVVHPESGEVLAEPDDVLDESTPRAQHIIAVAEAYPDNYVVFPTVGGGQGIRPRW